MNIQIFVHFYAISENQGSEPIFVPFPGFDNLNEKGQIISVDKSDGRTDVFTPSFRGKWICN